MFVESINKNDKKEFEKPRVLMTNLFLCSFSGSELHTLSIAEQFTKKGYDVTIVVFEYAYPLLVEAEKIGVRVVGCEDGYLENNYYTIFWSQHYMVADYVILKYGIKCKKIVVSKLGVSAGPETLPVFTKYANLITCVSEECKQNILNSIEDDKNIYVFENYATQDFFKAYMGNITKRLQSVAIISNHIPKEVIEVKEILEKNGKYVQCYGAGYRKEIITPEILKNYDLVITIGKTVQWCFATGTTVYVYDIFGGPGFINKTNINKARENNFSGRGFDECKNSEKLFEDIINGYDEALKNRDYLNQIAQEEFDLSKIFSNLYLRVFNDDNLHTHDLSNYYTDLEKIRCFDSAEAHFRNGRYAPLRVRFYFDEGKGIQEKADKVIYITPNEQINLIIKIPMGVNRIIFKPCEYACEVEVLSVSGEDIVSNLNIFKPINTFSKHGKKDLFFTNEPSYLYENVHDQDTLRITFIVKRMDEIILYKYINETFGINSLRLKEELENTVKQNEELENTVKQYNIIVNSTIWRFSKPIRNILDKIKKISRK